MILVKFNSVFDIIGFVMIGLLSFYIVGVSCIGVIV